MARCYKRLTAPSSDFLLKLAKLSGDNTHAFHSFSRHFDQRFRLCSSSQIQRLVIKCNLEMVADRVEVSLLWKWMGLHAVFVPQLLNKNHDEQNLLWTVFLSKQTQRFLAN